MGVFSFLGRRRSDDPAAVFGTDREDPAVRRYRYLLHVAEPVETVVLAHAQGLARLDVAICAAILRTSRAAGVVVDPATGAADTLRLAETIALAERRRPGALLPHYDEGILCRVASTVVQVPAALDLWAGYEAWDGRWAPARDGAAAPADEPGDRKPPPVEAERGRPAPVQPVPVQPVPVQPVPVQPVPGVVVSPAVAGPWRCAT